MTWREKILSEFTPNVARLTLVADPDGLLLEEGVLAGIRERGFELIPFEDHVAFRYAYESKFRSLWDQGEQTDLVVVLRSAASDLGCLPYDLLQAGRRLSFNLGEIFPNLSYPIVTALDRGDLDALYEAQKRHTSGVLGNNDTKDFILLHVFEIVPKLIRQPSDLMRTLLRRHYREQRVPALLDERFMQVMRQQGDFDDWPIETIIPDREAFFAFLQERWPIFLNRSASQDSKSVNENKQPFGFEYPGPPDLPFDHDDIRVYIDNLFVEGLLEAVPHDRAESLSETWLAIGIRTDEQADRTRRVDGLLDTLAVDIPNEDRRHDDWFRFAKTWAELQALALESNAVLPELARQKMEALQAQIDAALVPWLTKRYAGLVNLPPAPPVMLHHIPRFLSRHVNEARHHKAAFVLVDGLALDQWIVIRKEITKQRVNYRFRENAVFAWIPTITSVSRQAAFAGKPPIYFPNSIRTTDKEPALWTQFWVDQGLTQQEVAYAKGLGNGTLESVEEIVAQPKTRVVGLVVDKVDKIMHGMELGAAGMHNQVRQWAAGPFLMQLFDLLLENGFHVYLSSDHGNIEASGCGRPTEGAVADLRGERARIYPDPLLRRQVKKRCPDALEWPPIGLPENYLPLLAPPRKAFVRKTESLVGHGGASLEELIVPLVQIERRDT
ncbi:MAG: BREX-3 system phosphatase PglZ [Desulfobacteraceae bacterium]|nr:BREX-3 system phosphatase PglZ [Desulfobacteraceae bacterium]MBC2748826.1 BREX-3 system phosphatase PglZ [Desulfobacteraceae bacterium]